MSRSQILIRVSGNKNQNPNSHTPMRACSCCLVVSPCCTTSSLPLLPLPLTFSLPGEGRAAHPHSQSSPSHCWRATSTHWWLQPGEAGPGSSLPAAMRRGLDGWLRWDPPESGGKSHQSATQRAGTSTASSTHRFQGVFSDSEFHVGETSVQWGLCAHKRQTTRTVGPRAKNTAGATFNDMHLCDYGSQRPRGAQSSSLLLLGTLSPQVITWSRLNWLPPWS